MADSPLFPHLPDDARIWIHPADAPLSDATQRALIERLEAFIDSWTSHEKPVHGGAAVLHDRFVVLAGIRSDRNAPSGCAIDDASHAIKEVAETFEINWIPSLHVIYQGEDGSIASIPRSAFQKRAADGAVTTDTTVFDPSVTTLGALRDGEFERPAGQSWHARAFSLPEPA